MGLSAYVLDVGAMGDVGYVSQNQAVMEQLKARIGYVLQEQDLLDSLELAIKRSRRGVEVQTDGYLNESQLGIGLKMTQPILSPKNRTVWKRDVRMSIYRNLEVAANADDDKTSSAPGNENLKGFLTAAANNPHTLTQESSVVVISQHIGATLLGFMMKSVEELDIKAGPTTLGMDSLVAIELRNWCRQRFGLDVSVLEIMGAASIEQLGFSVAQGLAAKLAGKDENA